MFTPWPDGLLPYLLEGKFGDVQMVEDVHWGGRVLEGQEWGITEEERRRQRWRTQETAVPIEQFCLGTLALDSS